MSRLCAALVSALVLTAESSAQNLVGNPDFDDDLAQWSPSGWPGSAAWNGADFVASPDSGSAELTATHPLANGIFYITHCVAVTGGAAYDIGARFFIPSGQGVTGSAELRLQWHTDATCSAFLGNETLDTITAVDDWRFSGAGGHAAPGSAQSVLVIALVTKIDAGGSFIGRADGVYVRAAGSTPNVYTVHDVADDGPGSLRNLVAQAITDEVPSEIYFDPALAGQTIVLLTALDSISEANTLIDGDLGGDCDPDIALDGAAVGAADGINLPSNGNTVRGLAIHSFAGVGVRINGNDNDVECNWIGTDLAQAPGLGNGAAGVDISYDASNNRVGPGNAIRHNVGHGVAVREDVLEGTYPEFTALVADYAEVFPDLDFSDDCGNFHSLGGPDLTDGGGRFFTENFGMELTGTLTVSAAGTYTFDFPNVDDQVRLNVDGGAAELDWQGGGTPPATQVALTGSHAIRIDFLEHGGAARLQVLVAGPGTAAFASDASPPAGCAASQPGLCGELYQLRTSAQRNTITQNGIGDNGGLGIAYNCCCGPTPNDPGDLDVGPNALLNHPLIGGVTSAGGGMYTVSGTAPPSSTVEIFIAAVDPSGFGEGNSFQGSGPANGAGAFAIDVALGGEPTVLTSTATDGLGNSSEFGPNFQVANAADELDLGTASGLPGTTIEVPVYVRDLSFTPLGVDRPAGERIQGLGFTVTATPATGVTAMVIARAGIAAALTPLSESSTGSGGTETYDVTYDEGSNPLPLALDAAAPGDQVATVSLTLAPGTAAGSIALDFTGVPPALRNQAGGTTEVELSGDLTTSGGSFTVLSNAAGALQAMPLSSAIVSLSWIDPNQNETGFRLERSTDGVAWSTVATKAANDTSHLNAGLSPATLYYYRLVTLVGGVDSHLSNVATAATFPAAAANVCRQRLTDGWNLAYNVSLASAGTQWAAAWTDSTPGQEERVLFQRLDANGAPLGAPLALSSPGASSRFPTVAWSGSRFGVLWNDHKRAPDGSLPNDVTFALLDANGAILRPHAVIGSPTAFGHRSTLEPVLIWDGSGWGIFKPDGADAPNELAFYRLDADGDLLLGPVEVTDDPDWDRDFSAAWNGSVYGVAWVRQVDATYDVYFQTMNPDGTVVGSPIEIRDHVAGTVARQTDVVWNGSGWAVAWAQSDANEGPVFLRLLDAAGNPVASAQRISDLLDPAFPPLDGVPVEDTFPQLFNKPGGGYVLYTWSVIQDGSGVNEIGRLEANAGGNKVGQRAILSGLDGENDYTVRGASDGTNFLLAWENEDSPNPEIVTLKLDAGGGTLAGPQSLTSGHDGTFQNSPAVVPLLGGFAALWRRSDHDSTHLDAKLFDAGGALVGTKTPLLDDVGGAVAPGVVAVGDTFAVAWHDTDTARPRFQRFDALGNALTAAVDVATSGGGSPQLDWSGEVFGVSFAQNGLKFQRLAPDGTPVGAPTAVAAPNFSAGQGARVRWVGSGWALLWLRNSDQNLYFALLDPAGNELVPATAITASGPTSLRGPRRFQMAWTGQQLGVAWDEARELDPPGADIYFTVLDLAGVKQFPEIAVVSSFHEFDTAPALYWDLDRFKLVHGAFDMRELALLPDGTPAGERVLGSHDGTAAVAWNGTVLGLLRGHQRVIEFETDECLADASPPPCPVLGAAFHDDRVALSWSGVGDPQSGLQSYNLYRDGRLLADLTPTTLAYDDGGFVLGQTHVYEVRAFNRALGESASCATLTVPTFANAALALLATALSSSQIRLDWEDPAANESSFRVERSLDGLAWTTAGAAGPDDTSFVDGGLSPATLYYYRLVTLVGANDSEISNVATAVTHAAAAAKVCFDSLVPNNRSAAQLPSAAWDGSAWSVAWTERALGASQSQILLRRYDGATLAPLGPAVQATDIFGGSFSAELVSNGEHLGLSWVAGVGGPPGTTPQANVFFSLFGADATPLRRDVLITRATLNHPFGSQLQPELEWDGTHWGHFSIEHGGATPGLTDLVYRRLDWNGDAVLTQTTSSASAHLSDAVAAWNAGAGKYGVAWMQIADTTIEVYFQVMEETTGVFEGSPALLGTYDDFVGTYGFSIVADGAGWAVAWAEARALIDESTPVWLARLDANGGVLSNLKLSDALLPPDGFPFDGANRLLRRPAGGYAVLFDGASQTQPRLEGFRLLADAGGARTGTRDLLTADDNFNSSRLDAAANGADVFLAWNETSTGAAEIGGRRIDADGGAMGSIVALTSGHVAGSAGNFQTAPLGSGFVVAWTDSVGGANLLQARIYDGSGAIAATLSPLSPTPVAGRPALLALGDSFAGAVRRAGVNETRFARFDASGAPLVAETVVSTNAGGAETAMAWSGESYGVVWRRAGAALMEFQRVSAAGAALGPTVEFEAASAGAAPNLHWLGDAWAVLWRGPDNSVRYARLSPLGAVEISETVVVTTVDPEQALAFHSFFNGAELGLAWRARGADDPPLHDIFFSVVEADGTLAFPAVNAVSSPGFEGVPALYWDGAAFRLLHTKSDVAGIREIGLQPDGTPLAGETLRGLGVPSAAAWNGATLGIVLGTAFETSECLADPTPPPCPALGASFDGDAVHLAWPTVADPESGPPLYVLLRDGQRLLMAAEDATALDDRGFVAGATHQYELRARNRAFQESSACPLVAVEAFYGDVPDGDPYLPFITELWEAGVAGGCSTAPFAFCPDHAVTREQMAVFLLRAKEGPLYTPPACAAATYADVPCSSPYADWIYELSSRGGMTSCDGGADFCPGDPVTREQMALFVLRTLEPPLYSPPPCTTPSYGDVPCASGYAEWVEELTARGVVSGCGGGNYCPANPVTRKQMAKFIAGTFSLTFP